MSKETPWEISQRILTEMLSEVKQEQLKLNQPITEETEVLFFNIQYQELDFELPNEVKLKCGAIAPAANEFDDLVNQICNNTKQLSALTGATVTHYEWEINL